MNNPKKIRSVCFIVNGYPTKDDPVYAFIKPIVNTMADMDIECTVIAPQSISNSIKNKKKIRPQRWIDKTECGNTVTILQPRYLSLSGLRINGINLSILNRDRAINNTFYKEKINPDVVYAHFWDCGIAAAKMINEKDIPIFVVSGESRIRVFDYYKKQTIDRCINKISGLICVSSKNLDESKSINLTKPHIPSIILPNAVNENEFYCTDKAKARAVLGLDENERIAIFVGSFNDRKGSLRVIEAVEAVEGLKLIMIGSGDKIRNSERIIYSGLVPHESIVTYLNAADVFVLPTLAEGCCNAIVEALACGLPVVSSNRSFNDDLLNASNSIRIDPNNINEITSALSHIVHNDAVKQSLSNGAKETGKELSIRKRTKKIINFIESI